MTRSSVGPVEDPAVEELLRVWLARCAKCSIGAEVLMHESDLLGTVVICDYLRPRSGRLKGASAQTILVDDLGKRAGLRPLPIAAGVETLPELLRFHLLPRRRSPQC